MIFGLVVSVAVLYFSQFRLVSACNLVQDFTWLVDSW